MTRTYWLEEYIDSQRLDPEFAVERLVLEIVGAIKGRMDAAGVTQEALAARMGVSQARISRALNYSGNVTVKTLARIACALECEWAGFRLFEEAAPSVKLHAESRSVRAKSTALHGKVKAILPKATAKKTSIRKRIKA